MYIAKDTSFVTEYLAGNATLEDIDDFIEFWHDNSDTTVELPEFLGLTWEDFGLWVHNENVLEQILEKYRTS